MISRLEFIERTVRRKTYYSVFIYETPIGVGVIRQYIEPDNRITWEFVPQSLSVGMGQEALSEIVKKVKELDDEYGPEPEIIQPAIRHLDLDD